MCAHEPIIPTSEEFLIDIKSPSCLEIPVAQKLVSNGLLKACCDAIADVTQSEHDRDGFVKALYHIAGPLNMDQLNAIAYAADKLKARGWQVEHLNSDPDDAFKGFILKPNPELFKKFSMVISNSICLNM